MKSLTTYIAEKMIFNKSTATNYNYHPKSKAELQKIIIDRIKEEGNELDLNDIDTSALTDLSHLFDNTISELFADFNGNISKWDVSNVNNMYHIFGFCESFNCDLSEWDVSKVKNMRLMFNECYSFEGIGLENWNVSNLEIIEGAFSNCIKLTGKELENWDVSNVQYAIDTFYGCKNLSCDLDNWNMSNCKEMDDMFYGCKNMDIPKWYKK